MTEPVISSPVRITWASAATVSVCTSRSTIERTSGPFDAIDDASSSSRPLADAMPRTATVLAVDGPAAFDDHLLSMARPPPARIP